MLCGISFIFFFLIYFLYSGDERTVGKTHSDVVSDFYLSDSLKHLVVLVRDKDISPQKDSPWIGCIYNRLFKSNSG